MSNNTPQPKKLAAMRYEQTLEGLYTQAEIPATLTWNNVQARRTRNVLQGKKSTREPAWIRSSTSSFKTKRLATIAAAVLILAILGGTAYAAGGFDRIISAMLQPGYMHSDDPLKPEMYTTLNLTSKDGPLTGKLEAAYADPNELMLGLSANHSRIPSAGKGGEWDLEAGNVTTSDGIILRPMGDATTNGGATVILGPGNTSTPVDPNIASILASFDTSQVKGNPTSLHIHAEFSYYCIGINGAQCAPDARVHDITHPYKLTYDLAVPFHAGKVVNVNKTITSDGTTVTLERVIIAPSGTRLFIHGLSYFKMPSRNDKSGSDETKLIAGDHTYHALILAGVWQDITNPQDPHHLDTTIYVPQTSVGNDHNWTLHILNPRGGAGWTFTFTM